MSRTKKSLDKLPKFSKSLTETEITQKSLHRWWWRLVMEVTEWTHWTCEWNLLEYFRENLWGVWWESLQPLTRMWQLDKSLTNRDALWKLSEDVSEHRKQTRLTTVEEVLWTKRTNFSWTNWFWSDWDTWHRMWILYQTAALILWCLFTGYNFISNPLFWIRSGSWCWPVMFHHRVECSSLSLADQTTLVYI